MIYVAECDDQTHRVDVQDTGDAAKVRLDTADAVIDARRIRNGTYSLFVDGRSFVADVVADGDGYVVSVGCESFRIGVADERRRRAAGAAGRRDVGGRQDVRAMMPGKVVDILIAKGDRVEANQGLLIIEAMKMENEIRASGAGEVKEIKVAPGQTVNTGDLLVVIE